MAPRFFLALLFVFMSACVRAEEKPAAVWKEAPASCEAEKTQLSTAFQEGVNLFGQVIALKAENLLLKTELEKLKEKKSGK